MSSHEELLEEARRQREDQESEQAPDGGLLLGGGHGVLGAVVWPTHMGVSTGEPGPGPVPDHEPWDDLDYNRGQIWWRTEDGKTYGRASVFAPKGVYTHFLFCLGSPRETMISSNKLDQPIVFDRAGIIDIDPIQCVDVLPRLPA